MHKYQNYVHHLGNGCFYFLPCELLVGRSLKKKNTTELTNMVGWEVGSNKNCFLTTSHPSFGVGLGFRVLQP
jgi:hypothetical protein